MARDPLGTVFDRDALPGATQLRRYGLALAAIVLVTMLGFLQRIFSTVELGFNQWAICVGIALSLLVVVELIKLFLRRGAAARV
jgi:Ca2+-transporting ATPase